MGAWSRAVEDGLIVANPWVGAKAPGKVASSPVTFWDSGEVAAIVAACPEGWQRDLIELLANTGLRVSTALLARWDWLDRAGDVLEIRPGPGIKTAYPHVLSSAARQVLARRLVAVDRSPFLFPSKRGGSLTYGAARDAFVLAIEAAGVRLGTLHDLRHTLGRTLALAGVPPAVIQRQLGHTTMAMTLRYTALDTEHVGRFVEGIEVGQVV